MTAEDGFRLVSPTIQKRIPSEEVTIAEILSEEGSATAHYGKWHLDGGGPEANGYRESDGATGHRDAAPFVDPNPVDIFGAVQRAPHRAEVKAAWRGKRVRLSSPSYWRFSAASSCF